MLYAHHAFFVFIKSWSFRLQTKSSTIYAKYLVMNEKIELQKNTIYGAQAPSIVVYTKRISSPSL